MSVDFIGGPSHSVSDRALGAEMVSWLVTQAEGNPWTCFALTSDGKLHVRLSPALPTLAAPARPDAEKSHLARNLVIELNRGADFGGAWTVAWYGDQTMEAFWKDQDGDIHVSVQFSTHDEAWARMRKWPLGVYLDACAEAFAHNLENFKALDVKPEQSYRLALGERAPSGNDTIFGPGRRG